MNSQDAYDLTCRTGVSSLKLEKTISKDGYNSCCYAVNILKGRFELGEEAISENSYYSSYYAKHIIKDRFKLGEKTIVKTKSLDYFIKILEYNHE